MALAVKPGGEAPQLARKAVQLVKDLREEGDDDSHQELDAKLSEAERALSSKPAAEALQAAVAALEQMLAAGMRTQIVGNQTADGQPAGNSVLITGKKAHLVKRRLREVLWVVKDAQGCFKQSGDQLGKGLALKALARVHLSRSDEPDAPMAALRCAKEAVTTLHAAGDAKREAEALSVAGDAHVMKAALSPYEKVTTDETENALQVLRQAAQLFSKLGDKKGEGKALHSAASVLLNSTDEDQQLEAERFVQEAVDLFKEIKNQDLECAAMMTMVNARMATSGPEQAVLFAKDTATDFNKEGGRPKHEATALHAAAELHLTLGELDEARDACKDAMRIFERVDHKRGVAGAMQTMYQIATAKGDNTQATRIAEDVASVFRELGDKRGEGGALVSVADLLLTKLCSEVKQDTEAATAKKDAVVGLTPDEVGRRAEEGLDYANRAFMCFEEIADEPGMAEVQAIIQASFQKGVDVYCTATEPDHIYTTLEVNGTREKESVLEWSIDFPHAKKLVMTA
mmetsp:Transcript_52853/g.169267  ORF Transcript_52853/g.169267 Transcript_52853/m.169267 type:complete len:515 (-) Transcript_52853:130-1674(-)